MLRITTLIGLCCVASFAQAADNGIYLGAGVGQSEYGLDNPFDAKPSDDEATGYKLIAGWRLLDSFGLEASYQDHGDATLPSGIVCAQFITVPCPDRSEFTAKTLSAFAVGYLDFPLVDLFAKAGVTSWEFDGHSTSAFPNFDVDEEGSDFAWGAGVQVHFGSLGARLEYERFNIIRDEHVGAVSLSVIWTFL